MFKYEIIKDIKSVVETFGNLPEEIINISTDSRTLSSNQAFLAIKGDNFDGAVFIENVIKNKCSIVITQEDVSKYVTKNPDVFFVRVSDSLQFYQELAKHIANLWKEKFQGKIIALTGSNGKTTNKEILTHLLNTVYQGQVCATKKNYNNHIGVPRTILELKSTDRFLILEMGTNHPGEIPLLASLVIPDAVLITNIGDSHLEFFKNREGVFREKRSLFDRLNDTNKEKGIFVKNKDDYFINQLPDIKNTVSFSKEMYKISDSKINFLYQDKRYEIENKNLIGDHNFVNLLASFLLIDRITDSKQTKKLIEAAASFIPTQNRSSFILRNGKNIFLDAYNANPSSMTASIEGYLSWLKQNNIPAAQSMFIIGDMNELGESTETLHQKTGQLLSEHKIPNVLFIGRFSHFYQKGFGDESLSFKSVDDLKHSKWEKLWASYKYFFIKGSRSLQLESLLDIK